MRFERILFGFAQGRALSVSITNGAVGGVLKRTDAAYNEDVMRDVCLGNNTRLDGMGAIEWENGPEPYIIMSVIDEV